MKWSLQTSLLKHVHVSTERPQRSIALLSYLFTVSHEDGSTKARSKTSRAVTFNINTKQSDETESKITENTTAQLTEVDDFEDDENVVSVMILRMRALESTTALSLMTFTSLLIEFVARLDHLVEASEKLAQMARLKQQAGT
ncbi:hypothetical protein BRADI_2g07264v3 [Brachypodium distachyon]|uniref:Uncharacterized protein n=1 Tax=Brachypodium distachyon TaxID=15368 RepID=A0A2K2D7C2_BRADI|nr:hypothetical protein BRADI_2g07264v3 [Brachypodium distachyon]